jgi:hypothetical protein
MGNRSSVMLLTLFVIGFASINSSVINAQENEFSGKRVVPILQEPRHRTVHADGDIYLLDVQINSGDMTLPHTHNAAILYTFISNGEGPLFGRVSGNIDYIEENFTHEVTNEGPGLFRIIALTNYGAGVPSVAAGKARGLTVEPDVENPWFRSYRIRLEAGAETAIQTLANPNVVVQVSEGIVHVTRSDGITKELLAMGEWAWREAASPYKIINRGSEAVELVVNEARR